MQIAHTQRLYSVQRLLWNWIAFSKNPLIDCVRYKERSYSFSHIQEIIKHKKHVCNFWDKVWEKIKRWKINRSQINFYVFLFLNANEKRSMDSVEFGHWIDKQLIDQIVWPNSIRLKWICGNCEWQDPMNTILQHSEHKSLCSLWDVVWWKAASGWLL